MVIFHSYVAAPGPPGTAPDSLAAALRAMRAETNETNETWEMKNGSKMI